MIAVGAVLSALASVVLILALGELIVHSSFGRLEARRVQVREKGKLTMWLCLQPLERVPEADMMVMHKLMIEADEETYLRKANRFTPTFWEMRERPDLQ